MTDTELPIDGHESSAWELFWLSPEGTSCDLNPRHTTGLCSEIEARSTCDFMCAAGYHLVGKPTGTCNYKQEFSLGQWPGTCVVDDPCGCLEPPPRWGVVCVSLSTLGLLAAPIFAQRFCSTLRDLPDIVLPHGDDASGGLALLMLFHGVFDTVSDIGLCLSLMFGCGKGWLLWSCFATFVISTATNVGLSLRWLGAVAATSDAAKRWCQAHIRLTTLVIFACSSRIQSMSILRLRIGGKMWLGEELPILHKHIHFIRYCGWHQMILADIPHLLVAIVTLVYTKFEVTECGDDGSPWLPTLLQVSPDVQRGWAVASIFFSCGSILWGAASRAVDWASTWNENNLNLQALILPQRTTW
eukprot:COSAG06_NODE_682_length_13115_cov_17.917793_9_plen_357_part_00